MPTDTSTGQHRHRQPRRHRRRRHRARGRRRGPQGPRRGHGGHRHQVPHDRVRPGRAPLARHRRDAARLGPRGAARPRRDPARRDRRPHASPAASSSAASCCRCASRCEHYVNLRPAQLYPGVQSPLAVERVAPDGIDFVVVREGTEGPYVGNGGALRIGTPHEIATEVSVNTRFGVERVVRDAFARAAGPAAPAPDAGAQAQRAHPRRAPVAPHRRGGRRRVPRGRRRPTSTSTRPRSSWPPTRGGSTSSSPTTCSATSSPTSRPPSSAASAWPPAATSTPSARRRACSSRSTARRPTSPARARPTRPPRSCRSRMLLEHLGRTEEAARVERAVAADLAERGGAVRVDHRGRRRHRDAASEPTGRTATSPARGASRAGNLGRRTPHPRGRTPGGLP